MPTPARRSSLLRGVLGALALSLSVTLSAAGSPADLVLPPLGEAPPPAPAWPGLASATRAPGTEAVRPGAGVLRPSQADLVSATSNWSYESNVANRRLGLDLEPVGDLNGDGFSDFAALGDVNSNDTALYIFFGSASGPTLAPGYPVTDLPPAASIAPAGDVNGDGLDDLAMFWVGGGSLRLYFGSAAGVDLVNYNLLTSHFGGGNSTITGAPAGDVDGDGYGDVIFGMPDLSGGSPCTPAAYSGIVEVMYGSASGLSASRNWYVTGCYATGAGARMGQTVAGAGDVNGDGYDDIVFGAPFADLSTYGTVGKVYVMYGSASGLPLLNGYANLGSVTQGSTIAGQHLTGQFGATVAAAGDLNGDGYADIAVGAPSDDNFGTDAGMAFVFRGSAAGVDTSVANVLWWESAAVANAKFGTTLASAGDVNGDGRPDLLVGEATRVDLAQSAGSTLVLQQFLPYPSTGSVVRTAGDVNGDGLSDLLAGESGYTNGESFEGHVVVHYGAGTGPSLVPNWTLTQSAIDNPNLGWSVASAGDVNGDGYEDVVVGSPTWYNFTVGGSVNNGLVLLFYGHATGLSPSYDWMAYGANNDQLGVSVAGADLNGDGYSDLVVGAHTAGGNAGHVCIWYGSATGPSVVAPNVTIPAPGVGGYFGAWVAAAGDVNNDGYPDIVVGAPNAESATTPVTDEGVAYCYKGSAAGIVTTPIWSRAGGQANSHLGACGAGAGDVNGDGYADLVIGQPDYDTTDKLGNPVTDGGRVLIEYGSPTGPATESILSSFSAWRFGASVAGAGDVNGDGYSDFVVGAPNAQFSLAGEGAARVYTGGPSGIGLLWTQYGGEANGGFGSAVSSAGDVDGDGLSDVLVGAVFQDMGGSQDQGRAYVYRGPLPAGASAFWTASGGSSFANLGHSLASAGDVNGDGWNDLVFGLPGYNGTGYRQGQARVYYGSGGGGTFQLGLAYHASTPTHSIQPSCMTDPGSLVLLSTGRSAAGRTRVRLQYKVSPTIGLAGTTAAGFTGYSATGAPGSDGSLVGLLASAGGLSNGMPYAWQVRTLARNVYFPTGPWRAPARSGRREADVRTPGSYLNVADGRPAPELQLADVRPNPMLTSTSVVFSLARAGNVSLAVHDVQGRRVRTLAGGVMGAGEHHVAWDGRLDDGASSGAGIYWVRLAAEGRVLTRKVVRVK